MIVASQSGHVEVVSALIKAGAAVDVDNELVDSRLTALWIASHNGHGNVAAGGS